MRSRQALLAALLWIFPTSPVAGQEGAPGGEWPHYGGDLGSTKYSALSQIDHGNVDRVREAWIWRSPDDQLIAANDGLAAATFKATPIMVDGVLYIRTNLSQVAAIDAASGRELWVFDPESYLSGRPPNFGFNSRGVAYWTDHAGDDRILLGTGDAHLWALDASTGTPIPSFGDGGKIDLTLGMRRPVERSAYSSLSPPLVLNDVVVMGSSISDGPRYQTAPPGDVRGFDVRTGRQLWTFQTVPQPGEFGNETWGGGSWEYTGGTNAWTLLSGDAELGTVYVPTGTPTNDWYGGHRLGDNLFAESLVALDARTGRRKWHFQFVHHGVWDYDLPAAPNLANVMIDGRETPIVAQVTKQGFTFVFNRVTGEPVWPIEERPVPASTVPGESLSPTQPIPTRPAPFERQGVTPEGLIDFSPELRAEAERILSEVDHGGLYHPPSLRGTINVPGWLGGADWEGAAVDPESGVLYVPSRTMPIRVQLVQPDATRSDFRYARGGATTIAGPQGLPLFKPPYARLTAIDLKTGEHVWQVPLGDGPRRRLIEMGVPDPGALGGGSFTGPVLTETLLFIGHTGARDGNDDATAGAILAFDKRTGEQVHAISLRAGPTATPISYMVAGKQYLVVAFGTGAETGLLGLALP